MFGRVSKIDILMKRVAALEEDARDSKRDSKASSTKVCEKCGCLVDGSKATKGKGEIRERKEYSPMSFGVRRVEYIYYPYYCMIHAPKEKK